MKRAFGVVKMMQGESRRAESRRGESRGEPLGLGHLPKIIACEHRLEEAVHFLVRALEDKPKRGKKPVAIHSLRVAFALLARGYGVDVVVAGMLHDVLEKTSLSPSQLTRRFGPEVTRIVLAATNNVRIDDPMLRYQDSVRRCANVGEGALLVRAADLIDNCDRLTALSSGARLERVAAKMRLLIGVCREEQVDPKMIAELVRRLRRIGRKVGSLALVPKKAHAGSKAARLSSRHR